MRLPSRPPWWGLIGFMMATAFGCQANITSPDRAGPGQPDGPGPENPGLDPGNPASPSDPSVPPRDPGSEGPTGPPDRDNPNLIPASELFACSEETPPGASPARVRLNSSTEWTNRTDANEASVPFRPSPTNRFSTLAAADLLNDSSLEQLIRVADERAREWARGRPRFQARNCFRDHDPAAPFSEECKRGLIRDVTQAVWRRQPNSEERDLLIATFDEGFSEGGDSLSSAELVFQRVLLSPHSVYRTEFGSGEPDEGGRRLLSGYELANAVIYALTDGNDRHGGHRDEIRAAYAAADSDELETPEQIATHVRALYWDYEKERGTGNILARRLGQKTRRFFREYLGFRAASNVVKEEPGKTSRYGTQRVASFVNVAEQAENMLERHVARVIGGDESVLRGLLSLSTIDLRNGGPGNPAAQINKVLNQADPETGLVRESENVDVSNERYGVMTHPAWLMAYGHNRENDASIVRRGVWILENLLCGVIPDIPLDVAAQLPEEPWSARRRLAWATQPLPEHSPEERAEAEYCWTCHKLVNPLGEPFEIFDHAGYVRAEDHGAPPDGSTTLIQTGDPTLDGAEIRDALDLMNRLAESQVVEQCFVRQVFRFYLGRGETRADACTLTDMLSSYRESDGSILETLVTLFSSDSFRYRIDQEGTVGDDPEGY